MKSLNAALLVSLSVFACACGGTTAATTDAGADDAGVSEGGSTCAAPRTTCSGTCVDTSSDPANCGGCGIVCLTCSSGSCGTQPTPDAGIGATPPPDPGGPAPDGTTDVVLAIRKLYMGDTDRNGTMNIMAWKNYGFDVDGKTTDKNSTDVCTLASGAARSTQTDGTNGIDNAFGLDILPMLLAIAGQDAPRKLNDSIAQGSGATILFDIPHVGPKASYSPLPGTLFVGAPLGTTAAWNGNDVWPIDATSVNGSATSPKYVFGSGYMNNRVWVGAPRGSASLPLFLSMPFNVRVNALQIAMTIAPDGRSASGTLSGVLPTEEYINTWKLAAGRISTSLCQGSAFDSIAQQIRQASDILQDGSNRAGAPCDGISIGIGFDATIVKLGSVATPVTTPDPCQ